VASRAEQQDHADHTVSSLSGAEQFMPRRAVRWLARLAISHRAGGSLDEFRLI